jgi:hypothetical protein
MGNKVPFESLRATGFAAWAFAICPDVALVLALLYELLARPSVGGPQVIMGVPPLWLVCIVLFIVEIPWFAAGALSIWEVRAAKWFNLVLFAPTVIVVLFAGGGAIAAIVDFHSQWGAILFFLAVAMTGAVYVCFIVRDVQRATRARLPAAA